LGLGYGGFFGAFLGPIAYTLVVRKIGFQKAVWPAFVRTLAGGFAGAFAWIPTDRGHWHFWILHRNHLGQNQTFPTENCLSPRLV